MEGLIHYLNVPRIAPVSSSNDIGINYSPANISTYVIVIAISPNGSLPFGPFASPPVIVLNHTYTTETDRLLNGTIHTFEIQPRIEKLLDKAHGDVCKLPPGLRNDGVLCLP